MRLPPGASNDTCTKQLKKPPCFLGHGHANRVTCAHRQRSRLGADTQQVTGQIEHRRILVDPGFDFSVRKKYHRPILCIFCLLSAPQTATKPFKHNKQGERQNGKNKCKFFSAGKIAFKHVAL